MNGSERPLVLHVIHHLVIGGMENGLVNLINHMEPSRYRHAVACIEDYSDFRDRIVDPEVEVVALHRSTTGLGGVRRSLFSLCRRLMPTIVHTRNLSGLDALLPARLAGVPHRIHSEHGWDVDDLDGRLWKRALLRRLHSPLVDRYIAVSKHLERYLVERIGIRARRISQIYNGVDTQRFASGGKSLDSSLPPYMNGEQLVVVGTVGRIQKVKDQATLVRAFAALCSRRPDLRERMRLGVVGSGPLLPELKALADTLGVGEAAWFPGAMNNIPEILRDFDLFVLPSLNEGISNTVLEAMASGLPVVASAVGGNVEIVEDGGYGRLFAPGDVDGLCEHLEAYASNPALREAHSVNARRSAVGRFSLNAMVTGYQQVYDQIRQPSGRVAEVHA